MDPFPSLLARLRRLVQQLHAYLDLDALQRHTQPDLAWISTADLDALLCTTEVLHAALCILPTLEDEPSAADEDLLMLIQDLTRTLAERHAPNHQLSRDLEEALQWDIRPSGVALTVEEVSGAAAFLTAHYRGHGLEQALLGPLGLVLPPAPPCFPPRTNPATRLPRGAQHHPQLHALATGPKEDVAICAACCSGACNATRSRRSKCSPS